MYPRDIEPGDLVLIRDNVKAYQLRFNLLQFLAMHYKIGDFVHDFNTVTISNNVYDALRTSFKQRLEFITIDEQIPNVTETSVIPAGEPSDVAETPVKTDEGGSANSDVNKRNDEKKKDYFS